MPVGEHNQVQGGELMAAAVPVGGEPEAELAELPCKKCRVRLWTGSRPEVKVRDRKVTR